jgi:hypothetical protein
MIKVASVLPATIELPAVDGRPEASSVGFLWFKLVLFPAHSTAQPGFNRLITTKLPVGCVETHVKLLSR